MVHLLGSVKSHELWLRHPISHTQQPEKIFLTSAKAAVCSSGYGIIDLTPLEQPSLLSWPITHILLMVLPRPTLIFWLSCSTYWFVSSAKLLASLLLWEPSFPDLAFRITGNNSLSSTATESVFHRSTAAFSSRLRCLLTNNSRGFFSWRGTGLSPFLNFTLPAYLSFCLKWSGMKTRVNRRADSILQPWSVALHAEQTALGSNPADMSVFQTLLVSSLKSCNLAVGAERHSSKEKGSDTSYPVFWTTERYFFIVFLTNALENSKWNINS